MHEYRLSASVREYVSHLQPEDRAFILRCVLAICRNPHVDNETTFELESHKGTRRIRRFGDYFVLFDVVVEAGEKFVAIYEIGR